MPHSKCIAICVFEKAGYGAVGDVYRATLQLPRASGGPVQCSQTIVVKLSRTPAGKAALEHEYSIYEFLSRSDVEGITPCLGLFRSEESDHLALVLGDGGQTLALQSDPGGACGRARAFS